MRNLLRHVWHLPRKLLVNAISLYQCTLSPDHGPLRSLFPYGYCRHEPTCSEYGKRVLPGCGAVIGSSLSVTRLLSCHPWAKVSDEKWKALGATER
ncbi:membrane protein insertion efficiency factor YidD [Candidatus Uhrbacteria bacterium]|nr:membrane protein insertion efficiency factor YidD [Candidatus Uhrbacteria bacterium]